MSARTADAPGAALADVFQSLSEPLMVLGVDRRVLFANAAATAMLKTDEGLSLRGLTLAGEDRDLHDRLVRTIAAAAASPPGETFTMLLKQRSGRRCAVLHVSAMADCQSGTPAGQNGARILLRVSLSAAWLAPDLRSIQGAFGLSQAEAEIALLIAEGYTPRRVARKRLISEETVRWHIKNIYSKTCTNRLVDLTLQLCAARSPFFAEPGTAQNGTPRPRVRGAMQAFGPIAV